MRLTRLRSLRSLRRIFRTRSARPQMGEPLRSSPIPPCGDAPGGGSGTATRHPILTALAALAALASLGACDGPRPPEVRCYAGQTAAAVAAEVRRTAAEVEPHPVLARRYTVRAPGLAGKIVEDAPGCAGAQLSLWSVTMPAAAGPGRAGPVGPRRTRLPPEP